MKLTVVMDLSPEAEFYRASVEALQHASAGEEISVEIEVVRTPDLTGDARQLRDGVLIGPGAPYENPHAANNAIKIAREMGIPLVAT